MTSAELRKEYLDFKGNYSYIKVNVYNVIEEEISDILDYIRCYDEEEYLQVYELTEQAQYWIDSMCGEEYKKHENAVILARYLLKVLVNSMYTNRSFEISNSVKTSEIVRNIVSKLSNFEVINDD